MNDFDQYEAFERSFDPLQHDRKARRSRKPKARHTRKVSEAQIVESSADDTIGLEGGFKTTYTPSQFEEGWLLSSLTTFYDQHLISDVVSKVKGGKEANVYRCAGMEEGDWLAAKVYRPRMFRNLRNDAMYREGRYTLNGEGRAVKQTDQRLMRALGKKTAFGQQVAHTSWLMYEFNTLKSLHDAGAAVPRPISAGENAILMDYIGDENGPAPTLSEIKLDPAEVKPLFQEAIRNITLMLQQGLIHGDLSAYNILYWEGEIVLIDFPQVVDTYVNSTARHILERDIERVCAYFGMERLARKLSRDLWEQHVGSTLQERLLEAMDDGSQV